MTSALEGLANWESNPQPNIIKGVNAADRIDHVVAVREDSGIT